MVQYPSERNLIITADDYGASMNINEGIKYAIDQKALTSISALTNFGESLEELKCLSDLHPEIGIGVHLNIVTGKPIIDPDLIPTLVCEGGRFYTLEEILARLSTISTDQLKMELRAQIQALINKKIKLDHLSDHCGIISLYDPFFDILTELASEYKVPVRSPLVASVKYPSVFSSKEMKKSGQSLAFKLASRSPIQALRLLKYTRPRGMEKKVEKLDGLGIPHPDLLIDCFWGDPTVDNLRSILDHLPQGSMELIVHLGTSSRQDEYPSGLDLGYFNKREKELLTVTGDDIQEYYHHLKVKRIGYSEIPTKR